MASVPGQDPGQEAQRRSKAKLATRSLANGPGQDPVAEAQMARAQGKAEGLKVKAKRQRGKQRKEEAGETRREVRWCGGGEEHCAGRAREETEQEAAKRQVTD